ncbi:MAG: hypothetical protein M1819_002251 [Sarea resinae]|nr:MAG: hypothetical protein M1819_002251 [Sarea resinae]
MASANAQGVPPSSSSSPSAQPSKTFSLSLGSSKQKPSPLSRKPLTPSNGAKRPHSSLEDSDDEDDSAPKAQLVSSFDHAAGGAISVNGRQPEKAPLVIQTQKNRDWREESRRKKSRNLLPAEVQAAQASRGLTTGEDPDDRLNGAPQAYGLTFVQTESRENGQESQSEDRESKEPEIQKTEDQLALEALMSDGGQRSTNLVLPAVEDQDGGNGWNGRGNGVGEEDSFKSDVASRPEPASLEDYAAVPVEEFGAALLRGMGWKEGDVVGKRKDVISKPRVVERRPALLGIGAKEVPGGVGDEFGAWGKAAKGRRKVDKTYNPVLLRNSKTGEMLTEDELKVKKEEQKREEEDWKSRRDRNLAIDRDRKVERSRAGSR